MLELLAEVQPVEEDHVVERELNPVVVDAMDVEIDKVETMPVAKVVLSKRGEEKSSSLRKVERRLREEERWSELLAADLFRFEWELLSFD